MRFLIFIAALWLPAFALAQSTVQWTTNYYAVTGTTLGEIRDSLARARPWKDRSSLDALTQWRIEWRYQFASSEAGCRCTSFTTKTTITMTLPRWSRPTNAVPEVATNWDRYMTALRQHEMGHAQIGLSATAEQQKRISNVGIQTDCEALKQKIDTLAQQTVDEYGRRDQEYDEHTAHGAKQGAFLPGRGDRGDPRRRP